MCNFCSQQMKQNSINMIKDGKGQNVPYFIPYQFPFAGKYATCPVCGKQLSKTEMEPEGRLTRSLCESCYNMIVPDNVGSKVCRVCNEELPSSKVDDQFAFPREIRAHIHESECLNWFSLMHNIVLGSPEFRNLMTHKETVREVQPISLPHQAQRAIPYQPQQTLQEIFGSGWVNRNKEPKVPKTYKGQPVREYRQT
jgi:hypothetical protein